MLRDRRFYFACSVVFLASSLSGVANAQTDHLHCYKVKDGSKFKEALVDLDPLANPPFALTAGCKLKGKVKKFCSPTNKTVTSTDAIQQNISGPALDSEYVCYKIKCDLPGVESLDVSDQFGDHTLTKIKSKELCVPVGVTTTTTTMPPTGCTVTFSLTDTVDLAALQFEVHYDNTLGEFVGSDELVSCTSLIGGLVAFRDSDGEERLRYATANFDDGLSGPLDLLTCDYNSIGGPAVPGDFSIVELDSATIAGLPVGGGNLCGAPITGASPPSARDATRVLRAVVGFPDACDLCECDTDTNGTITATDTLRVLRQAVHDSTFTLMCPPCAGGPNVTAPTETVTVTAGVTCP